ncbi:DUF2271 domain-containing protein [Terriglobus aquaticus]|uniref:FAD:protein FMN transferase n=1 Tax=Terriglobus aquaticus TaxID=940139 RepID=A0ABW9KK20_9BACT|nr:DUF2271 domain-containing protein [Terriglobus aquaticus]
MPRPFSLALAAVSALTAAYPSPLLAAPELAAHTSGIWTAHHENVLGTSLELRLRAASQADADRAEQALLAEFDRQSAILSAWDTSSEFSRWQATRGTAVRVSPELLGTLARFDHWKRQTDNLLNAAAADAAAIWQQAGTTDERPAPAVLQASAVRMQQPQWQLDAVHNTATRLSGSPLVLASFVKSRISQAAANAALAAGATGVMLNVGGDIVLRGDMTQRVSIADPSSDAENSAPLDTVLLRDRAIATSGGYRRNSTLNGEQISHLIDPRTAQPATAVLSASVVAPDAEQAGALATALAIASPAEAHRLLRDFPAVDALVVYRDGDRLQTANWSRLQEPRLDRTVFRAAPRAAGAAPANAAWNQNLDLTIKLDLPRTDDPRYRRPYVAVWIEDEDKYPVRTVALWFQKPKWLNELKTWYRDDRLRNLSEGTDLSATISSATRAPGVYTLKWDGKDNSGKLVKPGKYTVCVEAAREHGGYGLSRYTMDFNGTPQQTTLPPQPEVGTVQLDYAKR